MQTTANLWEVLCRDLEEERRSARAEKYDEVARKFLETARQVLRPQSPRLCDATEIAGDIYQAAGRREEAARAFKEALDQSLPAGATASAARLAAKLALTYDQMGEASEARARYTQAIELYERLADHSEHAMLLNQLGALCKRTGDFPAAEQSYLRAMQVAVALHGDNHPEVATAANNLGVACIEAHDLIKAETYLMQALSIREKCYGALHPEVAQSMANLAVAYHSMGNVEKARAFYEGALKIYRRFRPANDPETRTVQHNYESLLRKLGAE